MNVFEKKLMSIDKLLIVVLIMIRKLFNFILLFISLVGILFAFPTYSFANGGDQRVVEGKYLINLSRSPFTPAVGDKTSMLASFVDIQTDKLISDDLIVKVRIAKLGEARERKFLFEQENMIAKRGILEFQYTFNEFGLHEIFFDFAFVSNPQKVYTAPDFLLDIQNTEISQKASFSFPIGITLGVIFGFIIGWFIKKQKV